MVLFIIKKSYLIIKNVKKRKFIKQRIINRSKAMFDEMTSVIKDTDRILGTSVKNCIFDLLLEKFLIRYLDS